MERKILKYASMFAIFLIFVASGDIKGFIQSILYILNGIGLISLGKLFYYDGKLDAIDDMNNIYE